MDRKTIMEAFVRQAYEKGVFSGAWLLCEKGKIVTKGAVGFRDMADTLPIREESIFDIGSVSKQLTSTAIRLLRRRGLLSLDDVVTRFFPQLPYPGVTIRHLLTHTGGLPDCLAWIVQLAKKENAIPDNGAVLRFLTESGAEPRFAPGEKWEYCNTGYSLLAEIVNQVSGVPFADFLKENIFEPAGMHSTALLHRIKDKLTIPNLAYGLTYEDGRYALPEDTKWKGLVVSLDGSEGDGFVKSNLFDLLTWDKVLRAGTLLTKEEQELMYAPATLNSGEEAGDGYGLGWGIVEHPALGKMVWHDGDWPGYLAFYARFLDLDRTLILLRSREGRDARAGGTFVHGMLGIVYDQAPEPVQLLEELAVKDPDTSKWDDFCGKYEPDDEGYLIEEVFRKDGALYAAIFDTESGERFTSQLYPLGENTFGIREDDEDIVFGDGYLTFGGDPCKKLS